MNKSLYLIVCFLLQFVLVYSQDKSLKVIGFLTSRYDVNFWDQIEYYKRQNGRQNFTNGFGVGFQKSKITILFEITKGMQEYNDLVAEPQPPWKIQRRNYISQFNASALVTQYELFRDKNWSCFIGFEIGEAKFIKSKFIWYRGDGVTYRDDLNVSTLDRRWHLGSSLGFKRKFGNIQISFTSGHLGVFKGLNPKALPPITILDANSRVAIFAKFTVYYVLDLKKSK